MSKIALGRGLGSLIPQRSGAAKSEEKNIASVSLDQSGLNAKKFTGNIESVVNNIEIDKISKNPVQMRKVFEKESLKELADSIKLHGIIEPVLVTELAPGAYELIAGERRMEAAKIAGLKKVPAIIRKVSRQEKLELALIENIQRENLNPIEEAKAYKMLSSDFSLTQEEISRRSGKSRSRVANFLRLLSLPLEIQNAIVQNKISEGHGRAILSLQNSEKQRALFNEIVKSNLTVRQAEEKVKMVSVAGHTRKIGGKKSSLWSETEKALSDFLSAKTEIKKSGSDIKIIITCCAQEDFDKIVDNLLRK
jgi:ParB family transcriptional regulator, chromosome partitioning protein